MSVDWRDSSPFDAALRMADALSGYAPLFRNAASGAGLVRRSYVLSGRRLGSRLWFS